MLILFLLLGGSRLNTSQRYHSPFQGQRAWTILSKRPYWLVQEVPWAWIRNWTWRWILQGQLPILIRKLMPKAYELGVREITKCSVIFFFFFFKSSFWSCSGSKMQGWFYSVFISDWPWDGGKRPLWIQLSMFFWFRKKKLHYKLISLQFSFIIWKISDRHRYVYIKSDYTANDLHVLNFFKIEIKAIHIYIIYMIE